MKNNCFKNTYVVRKGGRGGPNTLANFPFLFDPLFLISILLTLFRMGSPLPKGPPPYNLSHISCNYETWHSYTIPKEDPKNI